MRLSFIILTLLWSMPAFAIDLNGQTEFAQKLALNSSVSARVSSIEVSAGEQIAPGDLLLTLDDTVLLANLDYAQARVDALAPIVERMQTELDKAQELFDRDSLALVELQTAEQNFAIAQADHAGAMAKLARAQYRLSQAELRAPIGGIVLHINSFPGQYINTRVSNQSLLTIADNKSMIATALLPLELWNETLLNRSAMVSYQKQSYAGKVVEVDRQITLGENNHPAVMLVVRFDANGRLPAGLPVKIAIEDK